MVTAWVAIGISASALLVTLIAVLIRVAVALSLNTKAVGDLQRILDEVKSKSAQQDDAIEDHETRLARIECVPEVKRVIA